MYIADNIEDGELVCLIEELHDKTKTELKKWCGKNYKLISFGEIKKAEIVKVIRLKSTNKAVGVFGISKLNDKTAGIFLLTTNKLYKGNLITFLKGAKKQIGEWEKEYPLILDNHYKKHLKIRKWLLILGFKPSRYKDSDFQIYYKGDIGLYNE